MTKEQVGINALDVLVQLHQRVETDARKVGISSLNECRAGSITLGPEIYQGMHDVYYGGVKQFLPERYTALHELATQLYSNLERVAKETYPSK
ncbi:hypothetical protein HYV86_01170 [Candidatus Woesearchaeota archaeon]|nr:hypothetical protein [Candidatus Woesearchaeota archaeon]